MGRKKRDPMTDRPWLKQYPAVVPPEIDASQYPTLVALLEDSFSRFGERPAYRFMGHDYSFRLVEEMSRALGAWLQSRGLQRGDRIAVMMPNVPQYPVVVAAVLRAGYVLVNVNPLYTARELAHQLTDAGAKGLFVLENFGHTVQQAVDRQQMPLPQVLVTCTMGDLLGWLKGSVVNLVVRRVKKLVAPFDLPSAVPFNEALQQGQSMSLAPAALTPDDIAVLQYTGGTTGVSKGAVLLHRNLVANTLQSEAWFQPGLRKVPQGEQVVKVCALPLYHIFAFTANMMLGMRVGACNLLLPNPRDIPAVLKALAGQRFHVFPAVNTLFQALANHADFLSVDWGHLKVCVGGGMAVQQATAKLWLEKTGCAICEGYGLSETSPVAACNPTDSTQFTGTIGLPLPNTEIALLDDDGHPVRPGQPGEIAIRGPQVMAGYWQHPEETAKVMTADGFFRSGDIGVMDERGYFRIVDRKKDMILVSGFNVYPNEVEDVLTQMPGIAEAAAVGVPDQKTGEAVKVVIVRRHADVTENDVRAYCEQNLTGYKRPRHIEFRTELPKTAVGKVLRRELRTPVAARAA
jgi:long-chain acyl-CoA synthetase